MKTNLRYFLSFLFLIHAFLLRALLFMYTKLQKSFALNKFKLHPIIRDLSLPIWLGKIIGKICLVLVPFFDRQKWVLSGINIQFEIDQNENEHLGEILSSDKMSVGRQCYLVPGNHIDKNPYPKLKLLCMRAGIVFDHNQSLKICIQ
ncbi:MAG: hypothetical protein MI922_04715 [Bacteroidales bacterium]|nr:hypothetical protein [Bacteroidales bacterium]